MIPLKIKWLKKCAGDVIMSSMILCLKIQCDQKCTRKYAYINSSPPSAAIYMRQWTGSTLVQVMACSAPSHYLNQCCLIVNRPLGTNFREIWIKIYNFSFTKCTSKCRLGNGGHFVLGEISLLNAPYRCGRNFKSVIFQFILWIEFLSCSCEIAHRCMP